MANLEEKILAKSIKEKEAIQQKALLDAEALYSRLMHEAKIDFEASYQKAIYRTEGKVARAQLDSQSALRDEVAIAKQQLIESVFLNLKQYLTQLSGQDLFRFIVSAISNETIVGDEIIVVAKKDYDSYQKILSTQKGHLVMCDLLNAALNKESAHQYQLKLSASPAQIENGFILLGTDFDLNFSYQDTLEKLQTKYEKKIYEELN